MSGESIPFAGLQIRVADKVGAIPFMRFAKVAKQGVDADDMEGLAAMYDLLEQVVHPDDWAKFEAHAQAKRVQSDELLDVIKDAFDVFADRPTTRPSDSSVGPRTIEPRSMGDSSSPGTDPAFERQIGRFEAKGRPDLALVVQRRQEFLSA